MPLSATSASVTVLTREVIENSHAATAADLLRAAPFLQIAQSGAPGGLTTVTIRGGKPNFTLVMIDGIPVNDSTNLLGGSFDLSSLPVDNIEQVEIVRGPLSSVYGPDAIGGVINFISRKGAKTPMLELSSEFGSFLRRQFRVDTAGTWKALSYSAGGTFLDVGEQVEKDAYTAGSLAANGSVALGRRGVLEFGVRWMADRSAGLPAGSGGPELALSHDPLRDRAAELILGGSLKGEVRKGWIYSIDLDRVHRCEDNMTPPVLDAIPPTFRSLPASTSNSGFTRTRFGATSRFTMARNLSLAIGAGVRRETGSTTGYLAGTIPQAYQISRTSLVANTELQYSIKALTATAGFSFDKTEGFGEVTSPRLGVTWRPAEGGPRLKSSWAKGFKLPSFYGLGNPVVGNPRLRPERARALDAGIEQEFARRRMTVSATYFRNDFRDLVDFDSATFHLVNRSQALIHGVEFGAGYAPSVGLRFGLDFSYMTWTVHGSTQPLRNVPHGNGGVHLDWQVTRRLNTRVETQWMGRRYDFQIPVPGQTSVGGYSNTNLSAEYEVSRKLSVYVRGDNLLDSSYHEYIGFPNPGVAVRAGVKVRALGK